MKKLTVGKTSKKIIPLRKLQPKGGDVVDLRVKKKLTKNGNAAAVLLPATFLKDLNWIPKETEVYVTRTDKGEILITKVESIAAKAS